MTIKFCHFANIFCLVFARRVASTRLVDALSSGPGQQESGRVLCRPSPQVLYVHSSVETTRGLQLLLDMGLENTFDGFPAEGNYSSAISMDFLGGEERTAIKDPPRPLRLARPPAGHFAGFEGFNQEEPGPLAAHQSQTPAESFPGRRNNVEHIVSTADSRDDEYDERREVTKKGSDGNNVRRGKKRLSDFKKLKHSDARLPEVTSFVSLFFFVSKFVKCCFVSNCTEGLDAKTEAKERRKTSGKVSYHWIIFY